MRVPKPKHVGQRDCVDTFVVCMWAGRRWLAMVDRVDELGWAAPGGGVKRGETRAEARDRELAEETGLILPRGTAWIELPSRRVPDPRETADAWYVTTPFVHDMGVVDALPPLTAGTDARDARWVRADTFADLVDHVEIGLGGDLFTAHEHMIREVIGGLQ